MPNMGGVLKARLPLELLEALDEVARRVGLTRSAVLRSVLSDALFGTQRVMAGVGQVVGERPGGDGAGEAAAPSPTVSREILVHQTSAVDKLQRMYRNQGRQI